MANTVIKDCSLSECNSLLERISTISGTQEDMYVKLLTLMRYMEDLHDKLSKQKKSLQSDVYVDKIRNINDGINRISDRVATLRNKLNAIREMCPKNKAIASKGEYKYRCVYEGGVKIRTYPSINAATTGGIIKHNEIIIATERVFITGESSIFLHAVGVGWLFENRG